MSGYKPQDYCPQADECTQGSSAADMLVPYIASPSSEESTPLLSGRTQCKRSLPPRLIFIFGLLASSFLFVVVNLVLHFAYCPLYPSTMSAIRRDWEEETAQHDLLEDEWKHEEQNHSHIIDHWNREMEWHEEEVARRIREENERQERVRREWDQEHERHLQEEEEYEKSVAHRILEEEERQKRVRKEWDQEKENHWREWEEMERRENKRQEDERQKWKREVEDHDQIEKERQRREENERQKLNMFWGHIEAHTCTTYATREYRAQLMNLPTTWEHRVEACNATPLEVHGTSYFPKSCEDRGPGHVIGTWEIDQHEPDCATFWNWYKDKGCTSPGSGKRRIEHYLENLPRGGDWREFCATTPARFHGMEFLGAHECFQQKLGTYGHWEIDDTDCQ